MPILLQTQSTLKYYLQLKNIPEEKLKTMGIENIQPWDKYSRIQYLNTCSIQVRLIKIKKDLQ